MIQNSRSQTVSPQPPQPQGPVIEARDALAGQIEVLASYVNMLEGRLALSVMEQAPAPVTGNKTPAPSLGSSALYGSLVSMHDRLIEINEKVLFLLEHMEV